MTATTRDEQILVFDAGTGVPDLERYKAAFNWEKRVGGANGMGLVPSELVTGPMALFSGQLYFGTFISVTGSNACDTGKGRVFAVDYVKPDPTDSNPALAGVTTYGPLPIANVAFDTNSDADTVVNVTAANAAPNLLILGLGVQQRPTCTVVDTASFDAWSQNIASIGELQDPALYLTALGGGTSNLLQAASGGRLRGVELTLKRPSTSGRVLSWATSVD